MQFNIVQRVEEFKTACSLVFKDVKVISRVFEKAITRRCAEIRSYLLGFYLKSRKTKRKHLILILKGLLLYTFNSESQSETIPLRIHLVF